MQTPRQTNPFVQLLGLIAGFVFFIAAVLLGGIVLAAIIGTLLIGALVVYIRVWWMTRKMRNEQSQGRGPGRGQGQGQESYVEVEYRVVDSRPDTGEDDRGR